MQKPIRQALLTIAISALLITSTCVFAQTLFEPSIKNNTQATPAQTGRPAPLNKPLSSEDFKNKVQTLNQETQNRIVQQMPKPAATTPSAPAESPLSKNNEQASTQATTPASVPPAQTTAPQGPLPSSNTSQSSQPPAPAPSTQKDIYTGFGGSSSGTTGTTSTPSGSSSGWNIKY